MRPVGPIPETTRASRLSTTIESSKKFTPRFTPPHIDAGQTSKSLNLSAFLKLARLSLQQLRKVGNRLAVVQIERTSEMKKLIKTAVATAALVAIGTANAAVVDLFNTLQATITDSTILDGAVTSDIPPVVPAGDILGGYRGLSVELKTQLAGGQSGRIGVTSPGYLSFSTDSLAAATGIVRWDGIQTMAAGLNPTGLGAAGVGFANALTDSFELLTIFADAGFDFTIEAYTDATHWSKVTLTSTAHPVNVPTGTPSLIPLLAFLDCNNVIPGAITQCAPDGMGGFLPVDFSKLGALQVILDPLGTFVALDLTLNQITTVVPEPNALALAGLALGAAGLVSRRRKI